MLDVAPEAPGAPAAPLAPTVAAGITGLGAALPRRIVADDEVARRIGVEPGWIERRTGIRERRRLGPDESVRELAAAAGREALAGAGLDAAELDLVLVATCSADDLIPGAAPLVAHALGASAAALDVNGACAGFLHALDLAASAIGAGRAEHVLVVGAEGLSRLLDHADRRTAGLFGDGARR